MDPHGEAAHDVGGRGPGPAVAAANQQIAQPAIFPAPAPQIRHFRPTEQEYGDRIPTRLKKEDRSMDGLTEHGVPVPQTGWPSWSCGSTLPSHS